MERHKLDVLSLFAGIVFVAIAVVGLTDAVTVSITDLRWLGPAALVGFGVVLVMTAGGAVGRRGDDRDVTDGSPGEGDDDGEGQPAAFPADETLPADGATHPGAASPEDE